MQKNFGLKSNDFWLDGLRKHLESFWVGVRQGVRSGYVSNRVDESLSYPDLTPCLTPTPLQTLYLGGGTPSLLSLAEIERVLEILSPVYRLNPETEFTIECNPETLSADYLRGLRKLGINRLSLGVQSSLPDQLRRLERLATSKKIAQTVEEIAREFTNWSIDLMIGIADQTLKSLEIDLDWIEQIQPPHLSVYILTLSEDHRMKKHPSISKRLSSDELVQQMYLRVCEKLEKLSYQHYEVSNFAKAGFESRHNSNYWKVESNYLALGPGAHGYLQTQKTGQLFRYECVRDPDAWQKSATGIESAEELSEEQQRLERLYLSLRTKSPIPITELNSGSISALESQGWVKTEGGALTLTESGWLLMESIAERLII